MEIWFIEFTICLHYNLQLLIYDLYYDITEIEILNMLYQY